MPARLSGMAFRRCGRRYGGIGELRGVSRVETAMKSIRTYQREIRKLRKRIAVLEDRLYSMVPETIPHTLEQDMKRGQTLMVRVPSQFMVRE